MKSAITAASPAARSFGSSASAASTTTLPATKLAGSRPSMYSGWPGDVCSTSLIQIAGCSSGCITAKKSQNVSGAVKSSPLTPESLIACHCAANSLNAGACSAYAAAPAPSGRRTPSTVSSTSPPPLSSSAVSATRRGSVARCTGPRVQRRERRGRVRRAERGAIDCRHRYLVNLEKRRFQPQT